MQKPFVLEGVWRAPVAPSLNLTVEVELDAAGEVRAIGVVDAQQLAKERVAQLSDAAQRHGKLAVAMAQQGLGALGDKVGSLPPERRKLYVKAAFGAGIAIALLIGGLALFGSGPSKRTFARLIDADFEDAQVCWPASGAERLQFPIDVDQYSLRSEPVLQGLLRGGYLSAAKSVRNLRLFQTLSLSQKGEAAKIWDPAKGFCVGRPEVDEVVRWTEPASNGQAIATNVTYTWKLGDRPSWVDPKEFPGVEGMNRSVQAQVMAQKTSDGWEVVNLNKLLKQALQQVP
jgi:hypothetical protein